LRFVKIGGRLNCRAHILWTNRAARQEEWKKRDDDDFAHQSCPPSSAADPGMSSAAFFSLPATRSTTTYRTGTRKTPRTVAAVIPVMTEVPSTWRPIAPAPFAVQRGTQPRMKAKDV